MKHVQNINQEQEMEEKTNVTTVVIILGIIALMLFAMGYAFLK